MHRRGGIERTGQPDVHRKLRRLTHAADKKEQRDSGRAVDVPSRQGRQRDGGFDRLSEQRRELQRAVQRMGEDKPGEKCDVADPQERKGSIGARQRRCMCVVVGQEIEQTAQ